MFLKMKAFTIACSACLITGVALASPNSRQFTDDGLVHLKAGEFEKAVTKFEYATRSDANDGRAQFFFGVGMNRLGRASDAVTWIRKARSLGYDNPDMDVEEGVALNGVNRFEAAHAVLLRYLKRNPKHAVGSLAMGRALIGLGDYNLAEKSIKSARQLDRNLTEPANFLLALIERKRGKDVGALASFSPATENGEPTSRFGRTLRDFRNQRSVTRRPGDKPWSVGAIVALGYNDNVFGFADLPLALPSDISSRESGFVSFGADGRYNWFVTPNDVVSAGYGLSGTINFEDDEADDHNHRMFLNYAHGFTPNLEAAILLAYGFSVLGGDWFSDTVALRPSLAYRINPRVTVEAAYGFADTDFDTTPDLSVQDRDSNTHTFSATAFLDLAGVVPGDPRLRFGFTHTANDADGGDFDYDSFGFNGGVALDLPWQLGLDIFGAYSNINYDNPNSLAFDGITLFAFARDDEYVTAGLRLSRPVVEGIELFGSYRYSENTSNIVFYNYDQNVWSLGLQARY